VSDTPKTLSNEIERVLRDDLLRLASFLEVLDALLRELPIVSSELGGEIPDDPSLE